MEFDKELFIAELARDLDVSKSVAHELALLAGYDRELVIKASRGSSGLNECKAKIIDARFEKGEQNSDSSNRR